MNPLQYFKNLKETLSKEDPVYVDLEPDMVIDFGYLSSPIVTSIYKDPTDLVEKIDRVYHSVQNESQCVTAYNYCFRLISVLDISDDVYDDLYLYLHAKVIEFNNKIFQYDKPLEIEYQDN